jgi:flavin reductase (DIM6/NTAB) family NADH-FMN oxidoreductase RutF
MILTKENIEQLEQRYRTAFINSLAGFRQAVLVGTKSKDGNSNLAIFNSLMHLGAQPALYGSSADRIALKEIRCKIFLPQKNTP